MKWRVKTTRLVDNPMHTICRQELSMTSSPGVRRNHGRLSIMSLALLYHN